jgi:hypothetical protein
MYFLIIIIMIIFFLYFFNKNIEKFWVYGAGTRVCNNRDCDIADRTNISTPI